MSGFSIGVFALSLVLGLCVFLLRGTRLEATAVRVLPWIFVAAAIPFLSGIGDAAGDLASYFPEVGSGYAAVSEEAFEKGIADAVCIQYGLDGENVRVNAVGFLPEKMTAEKISVFLSGWDITADAAAIEHYVEKEGFGPCEVVYESK